MTGIELIAEERKRQINEEGWSILHDMQYVNNELANAAATYAMDTGCREALTNLVGDCALTGIPPTWPWDDNCYNLTPNDRIRELVKAGALIAAEIDRIEESKWICPNCLKPIGDCEQDEWGYYYCPHCNYKGISSEFHTDCTWHPIHKMHEHNEKHTKSETVTEPDRKQNYDDILYDVILRNNTAATILNELFSGDMNAVSRYFKEGRQFWMYDFEMDDYVLITVTYVRSGIVFYVKDGSDKEESFGYKSVTASALYPRVIYLQDVADYMRKVSNNFVPEDLSSMYKHMKLDIPRDYVKIDIDFNIK